MDNVHSDTSTSLLGRLRDNPADQASWREFVLRYGPKIYSWCRRWQLQEVDAQDVTQGVLLKLAEKLREFVYDPSKSFRAWLKTLTHHAWRDYVDAQHRQGGVEAEAIPWHTLEARDDLASRLEREFDLELLARAKEIVRAQVAPHLWRAFEMTAFEGKSGAEAAQETGMRVAVVFSVKAKLHQRLRSTLQRLEGGGQDALSR